MKRPRVNIVTLVCLGFLLAASVSWGVFEAMPHLEDEHANLYQAKMFASGAITAPAEVYSRSFAVPFIVEQDGRRFSKYTPGHALTLVPGVMVGYPWLINAVAAALGLLGTYLVGRELFDRETGLLAAALGILSPLAIILAGSMLSHPVSMAALTLFTWAFLKARRGGTRRYALAAGALAGWAFVTRPFSTTAIGLPLIVWALIDQIRAGRAAARPAMAWKAMAAWLFPMGVTFLLVGLILPIYNWKAAGDPFANTYTLWWSYDRLGFGPQIGNGGYHLGKALRNLALDFPRFSELLLGWPSWAGMILTWVVIGLGMGLPPRTSREFWLLTPAAGLIVAHMAYWAHSGGIFAARYYAEAMPFLWILAARGLIKLTAWRPPADRAVRVLLPLLMASGILLLLTPRFAQGRGLYDISRRDARLIQAAGLSDALVFVKSAYWTDYANLSWLNEGVLDEGEVIFSKDLGRAYNQLVLTAFPGRKIYYFDRYARTSLKPEVTQLK
jgi:4-amino-4-deoxy-L-arabinose transferase-like glycosyltransferase